MKIRLNITASFIMMILISCSIGDGKMSFDWKTGSEKIEEFFTKLNEKEQFNGNVLITDKGKICFQGSFGFSDYEKKLKLNEESTFDMGSIAKQFTAMCIVMLQEREMLNYDDLIVKYLTEIPYRNITIRQLLTHTSGLPDYVEFKNIEYDPWKIFDNRDIISILIEENPQLLFEPGTKWQYSNLGYLILGEVVQRVTGSPLHSFMRENIFIPLDMNMTGHKNFLTSIQEEHKTNGYFFLRETGKPEIAIELEEPGLNYPRRNATEGLAWIYTTTEDMFKWDRALYTEKLVSNNTLEEVFKPVELKNGETFPYGFGWFIDKDNYGNKLVMHSGGMPGYVAKFIRNTGREMAVIILSNDYNIQISYIEEITDELMKLLKDQNYLIPPLAVEKEIYKHIRPKSKLDVLLTEVEKMLSDSTSFSINEEIMTNLGYSLLHYDDISVALKYFELGTLLFPESASVYKHLGKACLEAGKTGKAKQSMEKALELDPRDAEVKNLLKRF